MTITLTLSPEMESKLLEHARACGQDVVTFVHGLIEKELQGRSTRDANGTEVVPPPSPKSAPPQMGKTLDEILEPIRQGFAESGMTEEELEHLFEEAREEVWQERQRHKGGS